jgi:alginate O-acetyltransferase complex protein AlgJ
MRTLIAALALACGAAVASADFLSDCASKAAKAEQKGTITVVGKDGWLFLGPELRFLTVGQFWGDRAAAVSRSAKPDQADPLPAILDFSEQLKKAGVELIVVPVPAKAMIYPEFLTDTVPAGSTPPRFDADLQAFCKVLTEQGIRVLDVAPLFLENRFPPEGALFCRQDSHWSGAGAALAAREIAAAVRPAVPDVPRSAVTGEWVSVELKGDLADWLEGVPVTMETVRVRRVTAAGAPVKPDEASPVVLLGDSLNMVFHAGGDMFSEGAGLPDQLALELGFPVDLVAVRGSGATSARVNLLRRTQRNPDYWKGKKIVVWCFAAREFTESEGWKKVPISASKP